MTEHRRHLTGETSAEPAAIAAALGGRLRALRQSASMTLRELADASGLSVNLLSRLENGLRRPTIDVLLTLARVHHLSIDELIGAPTTADPSTHPRPIERNGWTWLPLTHTPGGIQAYKIIMPAEHEPPPAQPRRHEGYEWLYVLTGRLRLHLAGRELLLVAREIAEFDTRTPHAFTNPGPTTTEVLILIGPQGQRAHVRARPRQPTST